MDFRCLSLCEVLGRSYLSKEQIKMTLRRQWVRAYSSGRPERKTAANDPISARAHSPWAGDHQGQRAL